MRALDARPLVVFMDVARVSGWVIFSAILLRHSTPPFITCEPAKARKIDQPFLLRLEACFGAQRLFEDLPLTIELDVSWLAGIGGRFRPSILAGVAVAEPGGGQVSRVDVDLADAMGWIGRSPRPVRRGSGLREGQVRERGTIRGPLIGLSGAVGRRNVGASNAIEAGGIVGADMRREKERQERTARNRQSHRTVLPVVSVSE
jgi:hypothetical protein